MINEKIRKAIAQRSAVDDEWDYGVKESWKNVLTILSESIEGTISFIEKDCTCDEFSLLSEIYDEIIDVFPDERIISTLRNTAKKYPEETKKYNIDYCIDMAEGHLEFILSSRDGEDE